LEAYEAFCAKVKKKGFWEGRENSGCRRRCNYFVFIHGKPHLQFGFGPFNAVLQNYYYYYYYYVSLLAGGDNIKNSLIA
jgi:hypothetical protein